MDSSDSESKLALRTDAPEPAPEAALVFPLVDMRVEAPPPAVALAAAEPIRHGFPSLTLRDSGDALPQVAFLGQPDLLRAGERLPTLPVTLVGERNAISGSNSEVPAPDRQPRSADLRFDAHRVERLLRELNESLLKPGTTFKELTDTLSTLNSDQIRELKLLTQQTDGTNLLDRLAKHGRLSEAEQKALGIFLKGTDQRTPQDDIDLARAALTERNFHLFERALRTASEAGRQRLQKELSPAEITKTFGQPSVDRITGEVSYDPTRESRLAQELLQTGRLSFKTLLKEQIGLVSTGEAAIKQTIDQLPADRRLAIAEGERLRQWLDKGGNPGELNPSQLQSLKEYDDAKKVLTDATNPTEAIKWLDYINDGGSELIAKLAQQRGVFRNGSETAIQSDLQNISRADWERAKSDPSYLERVRELLRTLQSGDALSRSERILDQKFAPEVRSFEQSIVASGRFLFNLKQEGQRGIPDDERVLRLLEGIDKGSLERYARDEKYRKEVDETILSLVRSDVGKDAARSLLQQAAEGRKPELPLTDKLLLAAESRTFATDPQRVRQLLQDIQEAVRKDPNLKDRILNPRPEDSRLQEALSQAFPKVSRDLFNQIDRPQPIKAVDGKVDLFEAYVKPLLEKGSLPLAQQASLGTYDRIAFARQIANASPEERQKFLGDGDLQKRIIGYWSPEERTIALRTAENGFLDPADRLRLAIAAKDKASVKAAFDELPPGLRPALKDRYERNYGSFEHSLESTFSKGDAFELGRLGKEIPRDQRQAFDQSLREYYQSRGGWFAEFAALFTGTGVLADNAHQEHAARLAEASKRFAELPLQEQQRLIENTQNALRLFIDSKTATADLVVDLAITLATLPAGSPGVHLAFRAIAILAAAEARPIGKALLLGQDYDQRILRDALLGGSLAALNSLRPEHLTRLLQLGDQTALSTAKLAKSLVPEERQGAFAVELSRLVRNSFENGGKIHQAEFERFVAAFAKPGQEAALKSAVEKGLAEHGSRLVRDFIKNELLPSSLIGGGSNSLIQALESVLDGKPTAETLSRALTAFILGGVFTAGALPFLRSKVPGDPEGTTLDSIVRKAGLDPNVARQKGEEFLRRFGFDETRPRNSLNQPELDRLLEPPRADKAQLPISDARRPPLKENERIPTEERDVLIYKVRGSELEFVIDKAYAAKLDEIRQLRLAAAEVNATDPVKAQAARIAQETLSKHPLRDAVLPEQVLQSLPFLPSRDSAIKRIQLTEEKIKPQGSYGVLADASTQFEIRFFGGTKADQLLFVLQHENAHTLQFKFTEEFAAFEQAARVERNGFYAREYATKDVGENWAVHFGEQFLRGSAEEFSLLVHNAPARSIAAAAFLKRVLDTADPAKLGVTAEVLRQRIAYVEKEILPVYRRQLEKDIASGSQQEQIVNHLRFLQQLRETPSGRAVADSILPADRTRQIVESSVKTGDQKVALEALSYLVKQDQSAATLNLLREVSLNPTIVKDASDVRVVRSWFAQIPTPEARIALLDFVASRGAINGQSLQDALRGLSTPQADQVLQHALQHKGFQGQGQAFFEAALNAADKERAFLLFQAGVKAGGEANDKVLTSLADLTQQLRWSHPAQSQAVDAHFQKLLSTYAASVRESLSQGKPLSETLFGLLRSKDPLDRALAYQNEFLRAGGKQIDHGDFIAYYIRDLSTSDAQKFAKIVRPWLTQKTVDRLDEELTRRAAALPQ